MKGNEFECCICKRMVNEHGRNAEPLVYAGVCCEACDPFVIQARISLQRILAYAQKCAKAENHGEVDKA